MSALSYAIRPATDIQPFQVDVAQAVLDDVNTHLARARVPGELATVSRGRGVPLDYLAELVDYWRTSYDWRRHEAAINCFPQFTTTINGQTLHFLHVVSPEPDALPLILRHGWPGSIVEFLDVVGPLAHPKAFGDDPADAFHVVVPSLLGRGFSSPTTEPGPETDRFAYACAALMDRLGYDHYGVHVNAAAVGVIPCGNIEETTRRQTLDRGVIHSPLDFLAWFVGTVAAWTHPSPSLPEGAIDRERLLTSVMVSWLNAVAALSAHHSVERGHSQGWPAHPPKPVVAEVTCRNAVARATTIVHRSTFTHGEHVAAKAPSDPLVADLRAFFRPFHHAAAAVPEHTGATTASPSQKGTDSVLFAEYNQW